MAIRLILILPDKCPFDDVATEAQKQWILFHENGGSLMDLAKRAGIRYRSIRYLLAKWKVKSFEELRAGVGESNITDVESICEFCDSTDDIHLHHVVNRYDSPVMVSLCAKCHKKFHFLNKLYREPARKMKRSTALTMK